VVEEADRGVSPEAIAALLGGLGGAVAAFLLGGFREWWREEREREGLLRLLLAEIDRNAEMERTIGETTDDLLGSPNFRHLTAETWRGTQGRQGGGAAPRRTVRRVERLLLLAPDPVDPADFREPDQREVEPGVQEYVHGTDW
jgi:hypothetical protein